MWSHQMSLRTLQNAIWKQPESYLESPLDFEHWNTTRYQHWDATNTAPRNQISNICITSISNWTPFAVRRFLFACAAAEEMETYIRGWLTAAHDNSMTTGSLTLLLTTPLAHFGTLELPGRAPYVCFGSPSLTFSLFTELPKVTQISDLDRLILTYSIAFFLI
jgi:hypothetical protein